MAHVINVKTEKLKKIDYNGKVRFAQEVSYEEGDYRAMLHFLMDGVGYRYYTYTCTDERYTENSLQEIIKKKSVKRNATYYLGVVKAEEILLNLLDLKSLSFIKIKDTKVETQKEITLGSSEIKLFIDLSKESLSLYVSADGFFYPFYPTDFPLLKELINLLKKEPTLRLKLVHQLI